jgi:hypothetical protein
MLQYIDKAMTRKMETMFHHLSGILLHLLVLFYTHLAAHLERAFSFRGTRDKKVGKKIN